MTARGASGRSRFQLGRGMPAVRPRTVEPMKVFDFGKHARALMSEWDELVSAPFKESEPGPLATEIALRVRDCTAVVKSVLAAQKSRLAEDGATMEMAWLAFSVDANADPRLTQDRPLPAGSFNPAGMRQSAEELVSLVPEAAPLELRLACQKAVFDLVKWCAQAELAERKAPADGEAGVPWAQISVTGSFAPEAGMPSTEALMLESREREATKEQKWGEWRQRMSLAEATDAYRKEFQTNGETIEAGAGPAGSEERTDREAPSDGETGTRSGDFAEPPTYR